MSYSQCFLHGLMEGGVLVRDYTILGMTFSKPQTVGKLCTGISDGKLPRGYL